MMSSLCLLTADLNSAGNERDFHSTTDELNRPEKGVKRNFKNPLQMMGSDNYIRVGKDLEVLGEETRIPLLLCNF